MAERKSTIGRVFGWVWRTVITVYRVIVIAVILVVLGLLYLDFTGGPAPHVGKNIALVIKPSGALVDRPPNKARRLIDRLSHQPPAETSLRTLRLALRHAASDPRIKLAVLDFDDLKAGGIYGIHGTGVAQLQELARSIARFRASGKKVYAYGLQYDQFQYLPAVQADAISLDPTGVVFLQGFGVYSDYFKDALDKLGVNVNVFRVGKYKSAVEPFMRNDMSPAAKQENRAWLGDLWSHYQKQVASRRGLKPDAIDHYIAGFGNALAADKGNGAKLALAAKLVDKIQTRDQFRAQMDQFVGKDDHTGSFRQISARVYMAAWQHDHSGNKGDKRVALINVNGDIVDGRNSPGKAGGDTISGLLNRARRDDSVAAVVLRVNSPGGSVTAAEKIRRAELRVKQAGKPFVVSMSTLGASGGYWISMDANKIFAEPTTITGSIGIFGMLPNFHKIMNKFGVHSDGVGTSALAGAFRVDRPLTKPERSIIQSQINRGYALFTQGVAAGRGLPLAKVEKIAQGRVWSGKAAKKLGLVDDFGGLHAAVQEAAKLAHLKKGSYSVKRLSAAPSFVALIKQHFGVHASTGSLAEATGVPRAWVAPLVQAAQVLSAFNDPRGEYAYCFCRIAHDSAWR